ncbi:hypothetical protein ACMDB5_12495 [Flavobacterium sp. W1B]|uniref:hypothetical protein n=1 Tax=Flavobacterium sp. W1B TaxID=3394146 RepID=UPI0039BD796C
MDTETQDLWFKKNKIKKTKAISYTLEFKFWAVELSNKYHNIIRASLELETSAENIRRWKNQLDNGKLVCKTKQTESKLLLEKTIKLTTQSQF